MREDNWLKAGFIKDTDIKDKATVEALCKIRLIESGEENVIDIDANWLKADKTEVDDKNTSSADAVLDRTCNEFMFENNERTSGRPLNIVCRILIVEANVKVTNKLFIEWKRVVKLEVNISARVAICLNVDDTEVVAMNENTELIPFEKAEFIEDNEDNARLEERNLKVLAKTLAKEVIDNPITDSLK